MTEDSEELVKENKENSKSSVTSSRLKTTNNSKESQKRDRTREPQQNRVVIRHLPPTMTSEQFLEEISPIPEHNDYYFCNPDTSLGAFGFCRSYINFIHTEDVFIFKDKFDGYVFVDSKGNEFPAIVEFAPFQRIPRRRIGGNGQPISGKKRDNKCGTIEQDSDYIQFLEELDKNKNETNMPSAEVYLEEIEARDKQLKANHGVLKVSTPLIEFIKNKKMEKIRLREERRDERRRQMLEQKRIREEELQRKAKLLKQKDENKKHKEFDEKGREKSKRDDERERIRIKSKDSDKKDRNESKSSENNKKSDSKRSDKRSDRMTGFSNRNKSEKSKESNSESTFVVKVVQNSDKLKTNESNNGNNSDTKKSSETSDNKSQEINKRNEEVFSDEKNKTKDETKYETRGEKSENSSKTLTENSNKNDSKRIRNKDRPTREIYRPGAKRTGSTEGAQTSNTSDSHKTSQANKSDHNTSSGGYKQRVFTRSKH